ncbi:MAG TPA: hypothetical protein VG605_15670 [Puia sp.]|nr:hypothetical protein [Puia sp.]
MRFFSIVFLTLSFLSARTLAQSSCKRSSALFKFDPHIHPRNFTEKLGNHPQFPFLQHENGVTTRALFIRAVRNADNRKKYRMEFDAFNRLLKDIGFVHGYKDVRSANVENLFINPGAIGNLGFFNKENGYIYVRLNPAGEGDDGVAAWKITGPGGCYFYILHTCGNAFFANDPAGGGPGCCREIGVRVTTDTLNTAAAHNRPFHLVVRFYQGVIGAHHSPSSAAGRKKGALDTVYRLMRSIDTTTLMKDNAGRPGNVYGKPWSDRWVLCKDTLLELHIPLSIDTAGNKLEYRHSDTSYIRLGGRDNDDCRKKWEIDASGGGSFNSIPRFDNTAQHSRTDGARPFAGLAISHLFNHWFQAGIEAAYITLSYQDDIAYPGSAPNTYNTVYPGKPIIPVQLFGRATIGGPRGWQANVSLSAGYSFVSGSRIVNSGATLTAKPATKGGLTAGGGMSIAYFFSCKFGLALNVSGQYFNNKASTGNYHLVALPIGLGIRYRL